MQGRVRFVAKHIRVENSRPIVLTTLFRPTDPLRYAPRLLARNRLASSSAVITVENVAASSAGSTRPTRSGSTSLPASIPRVSCIGPAIVAIARIANGSTCVPAAPTARALKSASCLLRNLLRRPQAQSAPRTDALVASPRASKARGTGALSKHIGVLIACFP
jgi:hypothetical protein